MSPTTEARRRTIAVGVVAGQDAVLDFAQVEAELTRSHLLLVHAYEVLPTIAAPALGLDLAEDFRLGGQEILAEALEHLARSGVACRVERVLTRGHAPAVLEAESRRARLMIIGQDADKPLIVRLFEGRVARRLVEHADCPVVVVPDSWRPDQGSGPVVVMIDGHSTAHGPLALAFETAATHDAELQVLHVVPPGGRAVSGWDDMQPLVEAWYTRYPHVLGTVHVVEGDPHEQALHAARGAGILVMGRPGQRRTSSFMIDTLAQEIIGEAACPVAVVASDYRGH